MKKVFVIGNCHTLPLSRIIMTRSSDIDVTFIDVNMVDHEPFKARASDVMVPCEDKLILTMPLSDQWGELATQNLRKLYKSGIIVFSNLYFSGLHPDMTYLGVMGGRVPSVMGDYHSRLILMSFAEGLTRQECEMQFNIEIFRQIGYIDAFEISATEACRRDESCDIKFSRDFVNMNSVRLSLLTMNHPTNVVFDVLSSQLMSALKLNFIDIPHEYLPHGLSENCIWPIYDDIASAHRLPYRTPQRFFSQVGELSRAMRLTEFIDRSFNIYEKYPKEELLIEAAKLPEYAAFSRKSSSTRSFRWRPAWLETFARFRFGSSSIQ